MALISVWLLVGTFLCLTNANSQTPPNFQIPSNLQTPQVNTQIPTQTLAKANLQTPPNFQIPSNLQTPVNAQLPTQAQTQKAALPVMTSEDMHQLEMINMPPGFSNKYLNFDPCLSSPCMFGRICKSLGDASSGYVCLKELDANKQISDAREVYRTMELLAKEAIIMNVETITNNGQPPVSGGPISVQHQQQPQPQIVGNWPIEHNVMLTLKAKSPVKLTCEQNPCQKNEKCLPHLTEGHICVKQRITVVEDENSKVIAKLLNDDKFISETASRCQSTQNSMHQRLDIPNLPTHFISCLDHSDFTIQTCPEGLVFNKHMDRCDVNQDPLDAAGCASSPCQFGAVCHDLPNLDYRCECPAGFTGKNCQNAPDVCASAPCGTSDGNVCHVLAPESGLSYYCTCFSGKAFGLSCEPNQVERNPCEESSQLGSVFSTRIGPSVFGLCDETRSLHLRVCDKQMQAMGKCKWLSKLNKQSKFRRAMNKRAIKKRY